MMVQLERTYRSRIGQLEQQLETMGAEKRRARQEWELKMREKQREIDGLHAMVSAPSLASSSCPFSSPLPLSPLSLPLFCPALFPLLRPHLSSTPLLSLPLHHPSPLFSPPSSLPPHLHSPSTQVAREVADLQRRQEAVEAAGPAFHVQIQAAREQLRDPFLSDAAYHELLKIPESERLLPDAVRIVVHEALADLRRENERLRRASAADRDGCVRAEEEAARAERARVAAERKAAQEVADVTDEMRALEARLEVRGDVDLRDGARIAGSRRSAAGTPVGTT